MIDGETHQRLMQRIAEADLSAEHGLDPDIDAIVAELPSQQLYAQIRQAVAQGNPIPDLPVPGEASVQGPPPVGQPATGPLPGAPLPDAVQPPPHGDEPQGSGWGDVDQAMDRRHDPQGTGGRWPTGAESLGRQA